MSDGSLYLYAKDETDRALREQIIKYADKPALKNKLATKRRPAGTVSTSIRTITRAALRKTPRLNVLYLTADPDKAHSLRVDVEVRRVQDESRGSDYRAVKPAHFRRAVINIIQTARLTCA